MKKILLTLLAIAGIMTACSKDEQGPEQQQQKIDRIVVDFSLEGMNAQTKSSNPNLDITLSQGCHVAFYDKSNKAILATGKCAKGETKIYVTDVPTKDCYVYGLANVGENFDWPETITELENKTVPVNVLSTTKAVPQSSTGTNEWTPGVSQMKINTARLYTRVSLLTQDRTEEFVASDIHVKNCPSAVYPFGTKKCSDESGNCDYATESDLVSFNGDNPLELFIPSNGKSTLQLKAARRNGDGFDYADTYEIYVPERDVKGDTYEQKLQVGKGDDPEGKYIIIIIGTDTRKVVWGASKLEVKSDGQPYSTTVKGYAENEGTSWNYKLTWTGKSSLEGTMINVGDESYPLNKSDFIEVTSIGSAIPVTFTSTSKLSADQTINIIAQIPDGMSATLPVTIKKSEEEVIEIFFDNANTMKLNETLPLKVMARMSNSTTKDITADAEITIPADYFEALTATKTLVPKKVKGVLKTHNITAAYKGKNCNANVTVTHDLTPTDINKFIFYFKYMNIEYQTYGEYEKKNGETMFMWSSHDGGEQVFAVYDKNNPRFITSETAQYYEVYMNNTFDPRSKFRYNSKTNKFEYSMYLMAGDAGTIYIQYLGQTIATCNWEVIFQ